MNSGESSPGQQASAEDLMDLASGLGAGAPFSPAGEIAFDPSYCLPTLVGNSEADDVTDCGGSPTQLSVVYLGHGGRRVEKRVAFAPGMTVQYYLKKAHAIAFRLTRTLMVGGRRQRMHYVPKPGESIFLAPKEAPQLFGG